MSEIPLLKANDIDVRIQQVVGPKGDEKTAHAVLLLYKNARVDMRILDEVYGPTGWQRTHEVINGNLFCTIEIWDKDKKQWIKKQDVGVPSAAEAEKGEASDSFKRAGTNVGIGRELYTAPFIYVDLLQGEYYDTGKKKNDKPIYAANTNVKFVVSEISYDETRSITGLVIKDRKGNVAKVIGSNKQGDSPSTPAEENPAESKLAAPELICEMCKKPIIAYKNLTAEEIANNTKEKYGHALCASCGSAEKKRIAKMNAEIASMDAEYKGAIG